MRKFRSNVILSFIVLFIFLVILNMLAGYYFSLDKTQIIALITASITLLAAGMAAIAIIYQLKANNEWDLRNTALVEVYKREAFSKALKTLEKHIHYTNLREPISEEEIHKWLCEDENCTGEFLTLTNNGLKIRKSIMVILNYYEYLAIGIKSNIFDEEVVKEMIQGSLINAYTVFSIYIEHQRKRHERTKAFIELEILAKKWISESSPKQHKRESTV